MKKNKKILLTALLIILIISINMVNVFAANDSVSPSSVHIHRFKRIVQDSGYYGNDNWHQYYESGYLNCTTCYHSEPYEEEGPMEHHILIFYTVVEDGITFRLEECTACGYLNSY